MPDTCDPSRLRFFLGGADLEMATIRDLVWQTLGAEAVVDHRLGWGAAAKDYSPQIAAAREAGVTPVLVELDGADAVPDALSVDHHNERACEPTALEQVFALLGLPETQWSRRFALIAANDRAHLDGMAEMGASAEEMAEIRADDRAAQGISAAEEAAGRAALDRAEPLFDGRLLLVRLPHGRMATVTDPLRIGEREDCVAPRDLLIEAPAELGFFGVGEAVRVLSDRFAGGWRGGALPVSGFWGCARGADCSTEAALAALATIHGQAS